MLTNEDWKKIIAIIQKTVEDKLSDYLESQLKGTNAVSYTETKSDNKSVNIGGSIKDSSIVTGQANAFAVTWMSDSPTIEINHE